MKVTKVVATLAAVLAMSSVPAAASECPSVLKFMKRKLNSQETVNLCDEYGGKTLLVVNTASYCGYTPQFEGLETLYSDYKDKDFVVLGFPRTILIKRIMMKVKRLSFVS